LRRRAVLQHWLAPADLLQRQFAVDAEHHLIVAHEVTNQGYDRHQLAPFISNAEHNHYTCPAGAKLTKVKRRTDHTDDFDFYRHLSACFTCPLKSRCTPTKLRRIKRWVNEDVLDRMQDRLDRMPEAMGVRRRTIEHRSGPSRRGWAPPTS
jgi:hypothetical protein